jgi:putative transposase
MPVKQAVVIHLSSLQKELLEQEVNRHSLSEQLRVRIEIILGSAQGISNNAMKRTLTLSHTKYVGKWRNRWADKQEALQELEEFLKDKRAMRKRLLDAMLIILQDVKGRGVASNFMPAQEEQIIAIACKKPADYGLADNNWTQNLLAQVAQKEGVVASISQSKICSILKKKNFSLTNQITG